MTRSSAIARSARIPRRSSTFAGAYAQGLRDAGVLPVLKHFPGHGHASGDSHEGGVVTPPLDELRTNDLIPYQTLTTQAPVAVMVGHMQVPGLTGRRSRQPQPRRLRAAALGRLRRSRVRRPGLQRRPVQHGRHQPALRRRRRGAQGAAGRCRCRAVGHHRRGARGAGPAGEGVGGGRTVAGPRRRVGAQGGRPEGARIRSADS